MSNSTSKQTFLSLFLIFLLLSSTNANAQVKQKNTTLEQQIIAAQQAAQVVQNQLSPSTSTQHNNHGTKMNGMRNRLTIPPTIIKPAKTNDQVPASKTMGKMKNMAMKKMGGMGKPKMMGKKMVSPSSKGQLTDLPAFPGNKHIYHIGADGFFLDKDTLISLAPIQQQQLLQIQNSWQSTNQSIEDKLTQAEQSLWLLTAEDVPNITEIKTKIDQISQLQAKQRLHFIQSVGKAASILNDKQRQILTKQYTSSLATQNN